MAEHKKKNAPVVNYIIILFLSAFLLLMMTYLMEQREVAESIDGIRHSVSAMQSVEELYEENTQLKEDLSAKGKTIIKYESEIADLQEDMESMEEKIIALEETALAMDWFWQINEAYQAGKRTTATALIEAFEEEGLTLPGETSVDSDRLAAAHRYLEIKIDLGLVTEEE